MKRLWSGILFIVLGLALWAGAVGVRRAVLGQQTRSLQGSEAPFLKESALQFRMTRTVYEEGTLPRRDPHTGVPDGVEPRKTYSVGAEWVYSALARMWPEEMSLTSRIRWASVLLFSLAVPFASLWVWLATRSVWGALTTGVLLAVSPAFAVRSSGLELSRENLAIPLFVLFFVGELWVARAESRRQRVGFSVLAALLLAAAQCLWDLTQYVTGCWALVAWGRELWTGRRSEGERTLWWSVTAAMLVAGLLNPYLRSHGFLFSPLIGLLLARSVALGFRVLPRGVSLAGGAVFLAVWMGLGRLFVENYSHFGELMAAKIRHGNVKPEDPGVLTYLQRIMWTPALNSSTWELTKAYFPLILYVGLIAALLVLFGKKAQKPHEDRFGTTAAGYALLTLPVYVFFFRFHVFLVLFLAVAAGFWIAGLRRITSPWLRHALPATLLLVFSGVEMYHLLFFDPAKADTPSPRETAMRQMMQNMGIQNPQYDLPDNRWASAHKLHYLYVDDLLNRLREDLYDADPLAQSDVPEPVLANFGISGTVLTYTGMPIVLHPKFETPGIRERVREFYEHLYVKPEKEFRDWAVAQGARYYLHRKNSFAGKDLRNSPPYMVDALEPPSDASWRVLEHTPERAEWFIPLRLDHPLYRVYRVISPADVDMARELTRMARTRYEQGDVDRAEDWALQALTYHWKYLPAREVLSRVRSARPSSP